MKGSHQTRARLLQITTHRPARRHLSVLACRQRARRLTRPGELLDAWCFSRRVSRVDSMQSIRRQVAHPVMWRTTPATEWLAQTPAHRPTAEQLISVGSGVREEEQPGAEDNLAVSSSTIQH
ncbi:hypothetical protein WOLCODRAFT_152095 [Wolfiporia cocos MD-104 SS10]|uniref:Uncharacterized protein n=1 Tax=Wolfiporia cocos (strain MD-104) TaxID=742152 RepID=A0A2H3JIM7_WOLCO|nr:hypothetical protein WOLCODRAFT_152095 [Wolfiporia cocos MD-104 SS10]